MRSVFISCLIAISLAACLNENRVDPAKPGSFVRYVNGGYDDEPKALVKANDGGYLILANTAGFPNYTNDTTTGITFKMDRVKLVKVDKYGTVEWTRILPEGRGEGNIGFHANGIHVFGGGYIISGEAIKSNGKSNLLLIRTDEDGLQLNTAHDSIGHYEVNLTSTAGATRVQGLAASWIDSAHVQVLGSVSGIPPNDMILAELDISAPDTALVNWNQAYGSSATTLLNKLFIDQGYLVFAGTTVDPDNNNQKDVRFLRATEDAGTIEQPLLFGSPVLSEQINGMCKTLTGYAYTGSSNDSIKTDRDILFTKFLPTENGASVQTNKTYPVNYPTGKRGDVGLNDEGNAISETSDHGFIILGTIQSSLTDEGTIGRGERDYYLLRIDLYGKVLWAKSFGSKREDVGVDVLQAEDGGFMILGMTKLANVQTIALIKTNADGEIE